MPYRRQAYSWISSGPRAGAGGCGVGLWLYFSVRPSRFPYTVGLLPVGRLRPHEEVDGERLWSLLSSICRAGAILSPILVDTGSLTVLDGHHRLAALRFLGARLAPVLLVDYWSPAVRLESWRPSVRVSKEEVVARAASGRLYPPRTTRHILAFPPPRGRVPLEVLGVVACRGEGG